MGTAPSVAVVKLSALALLVSLTGFGVSWYRSRLPPVAAATNALAKDPSQTATNAKPFQVTKGGASYQIEPLFDYDVSGLVVTDHDSASFLDVTHALAKDFLNTKDICLVWGENASRGNLDRFTFTSGDFTCFFRTNDNDAYRTFRLDQIGNNHVLPADEEIERALRNVEIGDEIRMSGQLVRYNVDGGPFRTSSTTRTDTGNGACEVLYVTRIETLMRHNAKWVRLRTVFKFSALGSLAILVAALFIAPFLKRSASL